MTARIVEAKVDVPGDLLAALANNTEALAMFERFPNSHKKEYVDWITSAKTNATRQRRIEATVAKIATKTTRIGQ